jgi:hypothetical protein
LLILPMCSGKSRHGGGSSSRAPRVRAQLMGRVTQLATGSRPASVQHPSSELAGVRPESPEQTFFELCCVLVLLQTKKQESTYSPGPNQDIHSWTASRRSDRLIHLRAVARILVLPSPLALGQTAWRVQVRLSRKRRNKADAPGAS